MTAVALTVKLALLAPAGILTEAGTVRFALLSDKAITMPPLGAAALALTVQVATPGVLIVAGIHPTEVIVGWTVVTLVIVPPVPETGRKRPAASTADTLATLMEVLLTLELIATFTTATTPFAMVFAFRPLAMQV